MKKKMSLKGFSSSRGFGKKGIRAIVATVLIILITIAAVALVWSAVLPLVKGSLDKGIVCSEAINQLSIQDVGWTCYNAGGLTTDVQIKRGADLDFPLVGINILVSTDGSSTATSVLEAAVLAPSEEKVYVATSVDTPDTVRIVPIIEVGNGQQESCENDNWVELKLCA